jgi:ribosomal protein L7/L12
MWLYIVGGVVLVVLLVIALRGRGGGRDLMDPGSIRPSAAADPPSEARVVELARANQKIQAIKMLRELRPLGLKEAKDWVDAVAAGRPAPDAPATATPVAPAMRGPLTPRDEEILAVARAGNKIEAIKMARLSYGWGLREAKDWVEAHA